MKLGYVNGYVVDLMLSATAELVGPYIELNEFGGRSEVHLLHVTQTTLEACHPSHTCILVFGSSGC
jgi:hypothetical protein